MLFRSDQATEVVVETGMASVSMLQRRLKLGYARAARLVDQLEDKGIVGPFEGSKPRQVLITKDQWQELKYRQGTVIGGAPHNASVPFDTADAPAESFAGESFMNASDLEDMLENAAEDTL